MENVVNIPYGESKEWPMQTTANTCIFIYFFLFYFYVDVHVNTPVNNACKYMFVEMLMIWLSTIFMSFMLVTIHDICVMYIFH